MSEFAYTHYMAHLGERCSGTLACFFRTSAHHVGYVRVISQYVGHAFAYGSGDCEDVFGMEQSA